MAKIYRLISGRISRPNAAGDMEAHKAPYDFVPLPSELEANRFRMIFIREDGTPDSLPAVSGPTVLHSSSKSTAQKENIPNLPPVKLPADIHKKDIEFDILTMSKKKLLAYIDNVHTTEELDRIFDQECSSASIRKDVLETIESRRDVLKALKLQQTNHEAARLLEGGAQTSLTE